MPTKTYHKLVRDRIPEIIEADGKTCVCETLSDENYISLLDHVIADTDALKYKTNESDSWLFHTVTCFRCIDTGNFPVLCLLTFLLYRIRKQL